MDTFTLQITLPDSLKPFVETQVSEGGYASAAEYIRSMLEQDQQRQAQDRLEDLLLQGLNSGPPTPIVPEDWAAMRARLRQQFGGLSSQAG
jgi:antitoxin ParD1/3/4